MTLQYNHDVEELFKVEAEKAEGMSLLHGMSFKKYSYFSVLINIPVIVLSSIVGFLSTIDMFPEQNYMIGALSIFIAIIKTMDSYFSWTQRSENHRIIGLAYIKISKFIQIQLALEREFRIEAADMLKVIQNDLQNLREAENVIDDDIILEFNNKHKTGTKPTICNGLTEITVNTSISAPKTTTIELTAEEKPSVIEEKPKEIPQKKIWR